MPELLNLARTNINFSNTASIGGSFQVAGTGWTIAGLVSQTAGIPLIIPIQGNEYRGSSFLPNATTFGDILYNNGYKEYFLIGSKKEFAGRDVFFETHGKATIFDYNYFHDNGYIPSDYFFWWGIEDRKVYEYAKEKITSIASEENPFFFTLLTADTHHIDGYLDSVAKHPYARKYDNVLADASKQLGSFIDWAQQQPWYKNTTIVILGDHLYMDANYFPNKGVGLDRRVLNIFINSTLKGKFSKNRAFTSFDIFPTLVDSIGIQYNASGLGLGRSLEKENQTLLESLGETNLNLALVGKSRQYLSFFASPK